MKIIQELDVCFVSNEHNKVFASKRSEICNRCPGRKRYLDRFSRFCRDRTIEHASDQQAERTVEKPNSLIIRTKANIEILYGAKERC